MANQNETLRIAAPLEDAFRACEQAVQAMGWNVQSRTTNARIECKEPMGAYLIYAMPATIEIELARESPTSTQISLHGTNFGVGPVAGNHVSNHLKALRSQIETAMPAR